MVLWDFLRRGRRAAALGVAAAALASTASAQSPSKKISSSSLRLYVGTYTGGASKGIYRIELDGGTGALLEGPVLAAATRDPSFLALHPNGRTLYAVNEISGAGTVSAFALDPATGALAFRNAVSSEGSDPCHVEVHPDGLALAVANYGSGTVALLPISPDGALRPASAVRTRAGSGPNAARQQTSHAHQAIFDPSKEFLLSTDLGGDRLVVERFDARGGTLRPGEAGALALAPGSGPRHLAFHPSGRTLYVVNELFSTVTSTRWDAARAALTPFQTVPAVPAGFSGENKSAEIAVSPDGRFVYVSNRGDDAITVFAVASDGALAPAGRIPAGGRTPRHFAVDPSGRFLLVANQGTGAVVVLRRDAATGLAFPAGAPIPVADAVCVLVAGPGAAP